MKNFAEINRASTGAKKTFNFFEKLWEHGRTLRRVGLVLVMCLITITQVHAWYVKAFVDGWGGWDTRNIGTGEYTWYNISGGKTFYFIVGNTESNWGIYDIVQNKNTWEDHKSLQASDFGLTSNQMTVALPENSHVTVKYSGSGSDWKVNVYVRPAYYFKYDWNNDGWKWSGWLVRCGDGTYATEGQYKSSCTSFNYDTQDRGSGTGAGSCSNIITDGDNLTSGLKCFFIYNPDGSTRSLTIQEKNSTSGHNYIYFDNTNAGWGDSNIQFVLGHLSFSRTKTMSKVGSSDYTTLYYCDRSSNDWTGDGCFAYFGMIGSSSKFDDNSWASDNMYRATHYSQPLYKHLNLSDGYNYVISKADNVNGHPITIEEKGTGYESLNYTQTVKYQLSKNGAAYADMSASDGATPATITASSYRLSGRSSVSSTSLGGALTVNTTTRYSSTITACHTGKTTLTVSNVRPGYQFIGWYEGNTQKSTATSYTYRPTGEVTVSARFKKLYAYVEGRFEVRDENGDVLSTASNGDWKTDVRTIPMEYDETNNRFVLHTHSTLTQLKANIGSQGSGKQEPYFFIRTSSSTSSWTDGGQYWAHSTGTDQNLASRGSKKSCDGSSNAFTFTGSEAGYVVLYCDASNVWYDMEYTVDYKKNGGASGADGSVTGTTTDDNSPYLYNTAVTTVSNDYTNTGYKFKWWNSNYGGTGEDFYPGEKFNITANTNLYAQWEEVPSGWAYWVGDVAISSAGTAYDVTGNGVTMQITRESSADWNDDVTQSYNQVSKYNSTTAKKAKVLAVDVDNSYIEVNFKDGSAINDLYLGITSDQTSAQNFVVCYSTTADFSIGEYEFVKVGSTNNVVSVPGHDQATKSATRVKPSTADKYKYVRIYRKLTNSTGYNSTGGDLGCSNKARIYSIKAQAGSSCSAPTSPTITGTTSYTAGDNISLTASATGTSGSTTYTWYKGATWDAASETSSIGSAATYTKASCVVDDAGTYWCNISNGDGCDVQVSKTITVACASHSVILNNSGSVTGGTFVTSSATVCVGETATLTATPSSGYTFTSWSATGTGSSLSSTTTNPTTLTMGTADVTVNATFTAIPVATIMLNKTATTLTYGGSTEMLSVTSVLPANALDKTYTWSSSNDAVATVTSGGVVSPVAAGSCNIYATANDGSGVKGTCAVTVNKADLSVTATAGTATSVTHNSATLPFTLSSTTGVASVTINVYKNSDNSKVATISDVTAATSGSASATGLSAETTYYFKVKPIGDANHNDGSESAKSAPFTTSAAPTLMAISANTLYQAADMATITLTSTETAWDEGLSSNNLFKTYGSASASTSAKGQTITSVKVGGKDFTSKAYIEAANNTSSTDDPTQGAIEFITPSKAGKLLVYTVDGSDSKLSIKKKGASSSTTTNATCKAVDVDANTHYFINGAGSKRGLYGIYYDKAPEFVSSSPADEATDVSVSGTIVLTFDESIESVDGSKFTITGATKGAVTIDGEDDTKVNVAYSGAAGEATVTLSIDAEAVTDAVGNKNAALSDISFTTENTGYTITFAANGSDGGSAMTNVTDIVSGSDVALAANTWTKTEHYFDGWKTNVALTYVPKGGGDAVNVAVDGIVPNEATIKNVTSNITLTAQWHANVYTVYFVAGEDARAIDGYTTYEYGEQKAMPTNVIRTGYLFEGWYDNSEYTGDPLTQMPADATGTKLYYAKWHELSSKCLYITGDVITAYNAVAADPGYYMYNDAKYVFGSGYDASASMLVLEAADGRSYVYLDPNIGEVKQVEVHISDIADRNVEDKGISWGFVNDDDDVATVVLTDMDQITSHAFTFRPTDENKQYFVFKSLATTLSIDNICVFYEPQTYTVTYNKGEGATGTVPATATYNYNDVVTVEAGTALAKDGYTFRGWFDGTTFYVIGDKFKVTHNTTLNAVWQSDSGCEGRSVGSLFKMQVATGLANVTLVNDDGNFCTLTTSNYLSTLKGGTAKAQNKNEHTAITGANAIALTNNDSYIEFSLPSAIQAGDLIIYSGASGVEIANVSEKPNTPQMSIAAGTNVTVIVGAESDLVGYSKIYMYRHSSSSTVTYFEVRRPVFYMSVGTPSATNFAVGTTAITTDNGLNMLIGATATVGCKNAAGDMRFRGSTNYDLHFYDKDDGYLKLDLDNALAQGDVISFTVVSGNNQLAITTSATWDNTISTSSKSYTIPALSDMIGKSTIYLWGSGGQAYVKTLSIIRAADAVSGGGAAVCHYTVSFACRTGFEALDDRLPENTVGVPDGAYIGAPEDPFAIGYAFLGWYDDAACSDGHEVDFATLAITENTTIYAKWENNVHTFTGDAGTTAWETAGNWDAAGMPNSAYPYCYSQVYIKAPAEIAKDTKAHVGRLDIVNDRSSNTGQLTIASGAMLIVYDKVSRITNLSTNARLATIAEDIYIGSERDDDAYSWREQGALNGALIMGDYDRETQADSATVQFATQSYTKSGDGSWGEREVNQYIGIPFVQANVSDYKPYEKYKYAQVYLMEHDRPNCSWLQMSEDQDMYEFVGYDIICYSFAPDAYTSPKPIFDLKGELASTDEERRIHLRAYQGYYGAEYNENILANSWTAPIDIASFEVSDFENAEATIYMFNAGTQAEYDGNTEWASNYSTYPGQYTAIPINDLKLHPYYYEGYKTIPSMQSFSVITLDNDGNSLTYHDLSYLTMDYKRLVYDPAVEAVGVTTETMHAPRRVPTMEEEPLAIMLHVHGMSGMGDRIRILEREDFSFGRDNGWETSKLLGIIEAPSLYAVTEVGDQATVAVPDVEGLGLTFQAGEYDNVYTFNFEYDESEEPLYLLDKKTGIYTRVLTENTYSFVTTDKNFNERFLLTRNYQMPEVATGLENTNADPSLNERVQKVLINDMIYILRDGHIYDATGKMLK